MLAFGAFFLCLQLSAQTSQSSCGHWAISGSVTLLKVNFTHFSSEPISSQWKRTSFKGSRRSSTGWLTLVCLVKRMLVHIYIYEYIFPLHPLWLHLKIEKNYHSKNERVFLRGVVEVLCYSWGKLVLTLRKKERKKEREWKKKCQHVLSQTPLVASFVTRKQDFFFSCTPLSLLLPTLPHLFFLLHLQHLQDKIAKLRGQSRFIIVMQKKLKCNPKAR